MIPYADFQLAEWQINRIKLNNQRIKIADYIKKHGVEPSATRAKSFYTASAEDIERYRRIWYALLFNGDGNGSQGGQSEEPSGEQTGTTSGNTDNSGSTETGNTVDSGNTEQSGTTGGDESGNTEPSGGTINEYSPSQQFRVTLNPIPCAVGSGEWATYATNTIYNNILNGTLLDYTTAELTLRGDNGTVITITDLTQTYFIPDGEYTVNGWIGRTHYTDLAGTGNKTAWHDWGWPSYDSAWVSVSGSFTYNTTNTTIPLTMNLNDAVIISDIEFTMNTGGAPITASSYSTLYYSFVRNEYHRKGASWAAVIDNATPRTLKFGTTKYVVDSFEMGSAYCYGWNNIIP